MTSNSPKARRATATRAMGYLYQAPGGRYLDIKYHVERESQFDRIKRKLLARKPEKVQGA